MSDALGQRPALAAALLAGGAVAALVLLGDADGLPSRFFRMDMGFLALPAASCAFLIGLGRLALWLNGSEFAARVTLRLPAGPKGTRSLPLAATLLPAHRALTDMGWAALGLGLVSAVPELPEVVSAHPWSPEIASLGRYLGGFESLALWGVLLLAPFIAARALAEARPNAGGDAVRVPRGRLTAFGAAYVLLTDGGALDTAMGLDGSLALVCFSAALGISYAAPLARRAASSGRVKRMPSPRSTFWLAEAAWSAALLGGIAALASATETALGFDVSGFFAALAAAFVLAYAARAMRDLGTLRTAERYAFWMSNLSRTLSALTLAAAAGLVVWAGLAHLPAANAALLDRPGTMEIGESLLPFLGGIYEERHSIALLAFTATAVLLLPRVLRGQLSLLAQAVLSAVSYFAVGCLTWLTAAGLSSFGHGFTFGGAIAAAGLFSLALTRLAPHTLGVNPALADIAGWLAASHARGFVLGAAVAFYALLLRPVVYEVLRLAALYEYIALLTLTLAALLTVVNRLRLAADTSGAAEPSRDDWQHHRQTLEAREDPRAALTGAMRQRFVERGDWKPLWTYLLGLLYRRGASQDSMLAVCRILRRGAAAPLAWNVLARSRRRAARAAAIEYALDTTGWALASPPPQPERIGANDIRRAAAPFVDRGTDPEPLAVALIIAQCQSGSEPEEAAERWFSLLDARAPSRPNAGPGAAEARASLVDEAIAALFTDATPSAPAAARGSRETRPGEPPDADTTTYEEVHHAERDDAD